MVFLWLSFYIIQKYNFSYIFVYLKYATPNWKEHIYVHKIYVYKNECLVFYIPWWLYGSALLSLCCFLKQSWKANGSKIPTWDSNVARKAMLSLQRDF